MWRASALVLVGVLLTSASAALPKLRCCVVIEEPIISCKLPKEPKLLQERKLLRPEYYGEALNSTSSENCSFNGLGIVYYHLLNNEMPEFKCTEVQLWETVRTEDKSLDSYKSFTGLTKYLKVCHDTNPENPEVCKCNIGVGGFSRNSERERNVVAIAPFVFDSLVVVRNVEDSDTKRSFLFFLTPFERGVWLAIFSLVAGVTVVMLLDQDYDPPSDAFATLQEDPTPAETRGSTFSASVKNFLLHNPVMRRIRFAVLSVSFAFAGHIFDAPSNQQRRLPTGRQRLLLLAALLFGTFIVLGYEASLVLHLFLEDSSNNNYRGVEDIFNCKVKDSDICIPGDGNTQSFWDEVATKERNVSGCTSEARVIREPCAEENATTRPANLTFDRVKCGLKFVEQYEGGKTTKKGPCRYFLGPRSAIDFWLGAKEFSSKVKLIGKPFYTNLLGFVLPRNSTWTTDLSKKTLKASTRLKIPSPIEYGRSKNWTNRNVCSSNDEMFLTFSTLRGFFIVAWSFLSAVWLLMCISIVTRLVGEKCGPSAEAVAP